MAGSILPPIILVFCSPCFSCGDESACLVLGFGRYTLMAVFVGWRLRRCFLHGGSFARVRRLTIKCFVDEQRTTLVLRQYLQTLPNDATLMYISTALWLWTLSIIAFITWFYYSCSILDQISRFLIPMVICLEFYCYLTWEEWALGVRRYAESTSSLTTSSLALLWRGAAWWASSIVAALDGSWH